MEYVIRESLQKTGLPDVSVSYQDELDLEVVLGKIDAGGRQGISEIYLIADDYFVYKIDLIVSSVISIKKVTIMKLIWKILNMNTEIGNFAKHNRLLSTILKILRLKRISIL